MKNLVNSVQLIGNLGSEVQSIDLGPNKTLAKVNIAVNDYYFNKAGEKVEETSWHRLTAWGTTGESMIKILTKGAQVAIKGRLKNSSYEDKAGVTRYTAEIIVSEFMLMRDAVAKAS